MSDMTNNPDVIVLGGGLGGVAAALECLSAGLTVIIVEQTAWLGGQATSQGVAALDEHPYIESSGASRRYQTWRARIRAAMTTRFGFVDPLIQHNPGNAWVSGLCFLPEVGASVLDAMLDEAGARDAAQCRVFRSHRLVAIHREGTSIQGIVIAAPTGVHTHLAAHWYIDATELGDTLELAGLAFFTGAEAASDTRERLAPPHSLPLEVQSFTACFAVEYCPGEDHRIPKPENYDVLKLTQPFTLTLTGEDGSPRPFRMFETGPTGLPPFWTYRRLVDGSKANPPCNDIALINWNGNDYHNGSLVHGTDAERLYHRNAAKDLSRAFLYWMQHDMPRDDGGYGYPELRLRPDVMGTEDGFSQFPYVRESRRTRGLVRITAEDILADVQPHARARNVADSVGIGWYALDLHPAVGNPRSLYLPTKPFQIPLGALIPPDCSNLVMANKNIATTHLSNGAYRLHPVEWQIGAAAGLTIIYAQRHRISPADIWRSDTHRIELQRSVLKTGQPICWITNVEATHQLWEVLQLLCTHGAVAPGTLFADTLEFDLDAALDTRQLAAFRDAWDRLFPTQAFPSAQTVRAVALEALTVPGTGVAW